MWYGPRLCKLVGIQLHIAKAVHSATMTKQACMFMLPIKSSCQVSLPVKA